MNSQGTLCDLVLLGKAEIRSSVLTDLAIMRFAWNRGKPFSITSDMKTR